MKTPFFVGFLCAIAATTAWAVPPSTEVLSFNVYLNEDRLPVDTYLRLSELRCGNCTLIVRDLIEVGAIESTVGAVKAMLAGNLNYTFRLSVLTECIPCYRAAHFWEMNMLNRPATNNEIQYWLVSEESKPLIVYFSAL